MLYVNGWDWKMKKKPFFFPKVCPCLALWPQAGLLFTCTSLHKNTERVHGVMALILLQCCSNMLSNNTGRKSNSIVSTNTPGATHYSHPAESPSLRYLLSEAMPNCGAAQNKTGSSGLGCIKNLLTLQNSHKSGRV